MKRFFERLLGKREPVVLPVLVERGEYRKMLTTEELARMKRVWAATLAGRAQDPCVSVILEMIETRIVNAGALVQRRDSHAAGNLAQVSYSAGEAAGLNDLLLELVRALRSEAPR